MGSFVCKHDTDIHTKDVTEYAISMDIDIGEYDLFDIYNMQITFAFLIEYIFSHSEGRGVFKTTNPVKIPF